MYTATTSDITVQVMPLFLEDESEPDEHRYIWAYNIKITNNGGRTVQLLNRYWQITDAMGKTEEVRGPGVIGKQPVLSPGDTFEYTSGCPLSTPSGVMVGSYEMRGEDGRLFDIEVPAFSLDSPFDVQRIN